MKKKKIKFLIAIFLVGSSVLGTSQITQARVFYKYNIMTGYETTEISLNKTSATIKTGESIVLKAIVSGNSGKVSWVSSNVKIASVENGKVVGLKAGIAVVTAKINGATQYDKTYEAHCKITVKKGNDNLNAYKKLIQKYEEKYGKAKLVNTAGYHYWTGLCFAKLLDFNGDGVDELILAYQREKRNTNNVKYYVELWTFEEKNTKNICSSVSSSGNNSQYFGFFSIIKYNGKYLLYLSCDGSIGNDLYYGAKSDGTLGIVYRFRWKGDAVEGKWYYNGKGISVSEYQNYYQKLHKSTTNYGFSSSGDDKIIKNEIAITRNAVGLK